ncbi:hypothetical protein Pint_29830 [Pistacia integerrima]|uniref:Uncharacterized protein n=1 Tax=Pistacia integerrima TaxID=434235 RepID=A0ACC0X1M8_9ROSI|nr:hypothetical protein Pint_29830 [Pistacia integerrima]
MNSNGSTRRVLWQSFDYPTDTLLPGMKLGVNLQTGRKWFLQSWISENSPAQGSFTLSMDPNVSNQLIMSRRGDVYWTSGRWVNVYDQFNDSAEPSPFLFNFSYTSNELEFFFNFADVVENSMIKIKYDDTLRDDNDIIVSPCDDFMRDDSCWDGKVPSCRSSVFSFTVKYGFMSSVGFKFEESDNMTSFDCFAKCFNNCSCVAFANDTGCEIWGTGTNFTESDDNYYSHQIFTMNVEPPEIQRIKPEIDGVPRGRFD